MDKSRPVTTDPASPEKSGGRGGRGTASSEARSERIRAFGADADVLQGRILISMPSIGDPRFERTVLLICGHDSDHAMAIVLNRPLDGLRVPGLLKRLGLAFEGVPDSAVLYGGPVERERGYVLHSDDYCTPASTTTVADGVALTDTREVLDALGDEARRPRQALLALGYAGWGPGQLESELRQGVWLTCDPDEELLFGADHDAKWAHALAKIGVTPDRLSSQSGRA
jgi:putative transcriptional regulator